MSIYQPKPITDERAELYSRDIIAFLEDQYVLPETREPIVLEDWQKEYILRPLFYDLDERGRRKYDIALLGMPKKNGKSALGAGIGIYFMYADEVEGEIIVAANDLQQASIIIYTKMRKSINKNPELRRNVLPLKGLIEIASTGTTCRCMAHQAESAAGQNPNLVIFDELWGFGDRKFFDELTLPPTRISPLILIVTYAGYVPSGLLWELYTDGLKGEDIIDTGDSEIVVKRGKNDPRMFMFWSHKNLASWVTPQYLNSQRRRLPPDVYARLHEARWTQKGGDFITLEEIEALHSTPWTMQLAPSAHPYEYIIATDLGLTHDRAVRAVGHFNPQDGNVYIDNMRLWEGVKGDPVRIEEVEQDIIDCGRRWNARRLVADPWQMEYVLQRLEKWFTITPFNFQRDMVPLSQLLVNTIRSRRLVLYEDPIIDDELQKMMARQTARGWRIEHPKKERNDCVVTVGMLLVETARTAYGGGTLLDEEDMRNRPLAMHGIREKTF